MAGETSKLEGICLSIHPWSRTSHVVSWLTPDGVIRSVVKGAVRPKSAFLGQYDLNYTCEITYYTRAHAGVHVLRECTPLRLREELRADYRSLALTGHFRMLAETLAPAGPEGAEWFSALDAALDRLTDLAAVERASRGCRRLVELLRFERKVLDLAGLTPDFSGFDPKAEWCPFSIEKGVFGPVSGRILRVSAEVARCLCHPENEKNMQILLDAARVFGVFYLFHVESASETARRSILGLLQENESGR